MTHSLVHFISRLVIVTLGATALVTQAATDVPDDNKIIADMQRQMTALQKQMIASSDPAEQVRLQKSLTVIMEEAAAKLSPKGRTPMLVGLRIVRPLQTMGSEYMEMIAKYAASPESDFTTIKSREDIKARIAILGRLEATNQNLIDLLNRFETDADRLLDEAKVGAAGKRDFMAGLNKGFGRQVGPLKAIRNIDTKLYVQLKAALTHLDQHWGNWTAIPGQPIVWNDRAVEAQFSAFIEEVQVLAERQTKAQQALSDRL